MLSKWQVRIKKLLKKFVENTSVHAINSKRTQNFCEKFVERNAEDACVLCLTSGVSRTLVIPVLDRKVCLDKNVPQLTKWLQGKRTQNQLTAISLSCLNNINSNYCIYQEKNSKYLTR